MTKRSREEIAAICIQKHVRGHLSRKKYVERLLEQFARVSKKMQEMQENVGDNTLIIDCRFWIRFCKEQN